MLIQISVYYPIAVTWKEKEGKKMVKQNSSGNGHS